MTIIHVECPINGSFCVGDGLVQQCCEVCISKAIKAVTSSTPEVARAREAWEAAIANVESALEEQKGVVSAVKILLELAADRVSVAQEVVKKAAKAWADVITSAPK